MNFGQQCFLIKGNKKNSKDTFSENLIWSIHNIKNDPEQYFPTHLLRNEKSVVYYLK